ncbi:YdcF family protein [Domibacillus sp. DTU_2020_1001157_1_SI_ALB_TIR_016]|uniref:YdcF family protein n=1 Tax=Domibacillus sp. DTU_2020_1001157_1_SI_ALB_TIR_016 TaxID=3077789 RepID=UPI0028E7F74E|nr:YdcF family protein [Domibacillus sp. DTU_2020_1001157_1_SI_ALB_TIR_016]WNS82360.1 YdcF family protein [Domibacillus sp. DTU_2020_1001157_1_SI_ALB_TIR_016]
MVQKRWLWAGFLLFGAGLLAAFLWKAGSFLTVEEKPKRSDAIVVLSPGTERIAAGVRLWKDGYGDDIVLSRANTGTFTVQEAAALGVPEEHVIAEEQAHSTYTNATYTKELLQHRGSTSAIIVTSDYHMRRTKFIFEKVFRDSDISLSYAPTPSRYTLSDWWNDEESKRMVWKEYAKLAGYYILY